MHIYIHKGQGWNKAPKAEGHVWQALGLLRKRLKATALECAFLDSPLLTSPCAVLQAACPGQARPGFPPLWPLSLERSPQAASFASYLSNVLMMGGWIEEGSPSSNVEGKGWRPGLPSLPNPSRLCFPVSDPHWLKAVVSKLQVTRYIISPSHGQCF